MTSIDTCISSHSRAVAGLLTVLFGGLPACSLLSIDPDEIDIAGDSSEGDEAADEVGGTSEGTNNDGEFDATSEGTDDAGDTTGDVTTSSGTSTDTGDTGPDGCGAVDEVVVGENPVVISAGASAFMGSCGGSGSETLYSFTAPAGGDYYFSLVGAEFTPVVYLLRADCVESGDGCSATADAAFLTMSGGETVTVVVDSDGGIGAATLVVSGL